MHYIRSFFKFWYNFIVGDDWTIAAIVAGAIGATFLLVHSGIRAWWVLPVAAIFSLVFSVWRASTEQVRAAADPQVRAGTRT